MLLFDDPTVTTQAYNVLREASFADQNLLVLLLPNIQVRADIPANVARVYTLKLFSKS